MVLYICQGCAGAVDGAYVLVGGHIQGVAKFSATELPYQIDLAILTVNPYGLPLWAESIDIYGFNTEISNLVTSDGNSGTFIGTFVLPSDPNWGQDISFDVTSFVASATGTYIGFNFRSKGSAIFSSLEYNYGHPSQLWINGGTSVPSVPEPSAYAMLGLGLGVLGFAVCRRKLA